MLLGTAVTGDLVLGAVSVGLLFNGLETDCFSLQLVDGLNKVALVLVDVTLDLQVQLVVQMLVNLLLSAILAEETAEDAHTADPEHLGGSTGVAGTNALTNASVAALELGLVSVSNSPAGHALDGLADDQTIAEKLADRSARVGSRNLGDLVRVKPDAALTASLLSFRPFIHRTDHNNHNEQNTPPIVSSSSRLKATRPAEIERAPERTKTEAARRFCNLRETISPKTIDTTQNHAHKRQTLGSNDANWRRKRPFDTAKREAALPLELRHLTASFGPLAGEYA